jgi:hypothetical protein
MSMSRIIVIVIGVVVALLGLGLVLSSVGVASGVHIPVVWFLELIVGLVLIGAGVWVIRGGNITA